MTKLLDRRRILDLVKTYTADHLTAEENWDSGYIPYARRVFDHEEVMNLVDSALDFWLTAGRYTARFEKEFAEFLGVKHCLLVNSGSSANLLAFMTLTSPYLGERAVRRGDEIITLAAGFPTTISPILQFGAVPVFVDITLPQYNIDAGQLDSALSSKTKAVFLPHTLGNPFDVAAVKAFCQAHNLWLIEDNCDALGARYTLNQSDRYTGTFGDIGTSSFYPPHHMTMGEGGAVYMNHPILHRVALSLRDWGRDCVCPSGSDNCCGRRFDKQFGDLPLGYDHKYVYSHFGYNLKATDMQAAVGLAQLRKLPAFIERRRHNFNRLKTALTPLRHKLLLPEPCPRATPSWFGFLLTCREGTRRGPIVHHLESKGIQTRMLFAGNLIKHPCFDNIRGADNMYRISGPLENTDRIMHQTFWIGVYPGLTDGMIDYMAQRVFEAVS